jgi:hypothetical protein
VSTRSDETTVFISGEPPTKPGRRARRGLFYAGLATALVGAGIGTLSTYLVMHHDGGSTPVAASSPFRNGENGGSGGDGLSPFGNGNGGSGGNGGGATGGTAVDLVDGISFPLPSGWRGGTTQDGHAAATYGSYTCADSKNTCTLAGADTTALSTPVSTGVQAAAEADITAAVKESYGDITGHQVLETKSVTVAGRSGYLVRWQVDAKVGNNGTVETVVFPDKAGDKLIALRMGFDIAAKAPDLSVMDQVVSGVADFSGGSFGSGQGPGGSTGTAPGTS